MISKRTRRATQPQETLRQFSLNNSKGVDETKAVTDINTVQYMENLKVNLDGSLSLRDRIEPYLNIQCQIYSSESDPIVKVLQIFSEVYVIVLDSGKFGVWSNQYSNFLRIRTDVYFESFGYLIPSFDTVTADIHLKDAELVKTATTATLGNCTVSGEFDSRDENLYDNLSSGAPRYLQFSNPREFDIDLNIKEPEPNEILQSEDGSLPISLNTTLDNPYAITDVYRPYGTDVKGILLYAYSSKFGVNTATDDYIENLKVSELTESSKNIRYRPIVVLDKGVTSYDNTFCFKALGAFSKESGLYASWFYTSEGARRVIDMDNVGEFTTISVREEFEDSTIHTVKYAPLSPEDSGELAITRPDCLFISKSIYAYRLLVSPLTFKVIRVDAISADDALFDPNETGVQYKIKEVVDIAEYYPNFGSRTVLANYDDGNSVLGKKILYKNSIYSYGDDSFKNIVFKSDPGSLITPYTNSIDSSVTGSSKVTAIVPWRDYLYIATETAALLATPVENGFYTKTVNTFVGISEQDANCCKATLNGIIFKSGSKVFIGYPNLYSEAEAVLNYTEISKPIESVLENIEYSECYALSTSSEYVLMLIGDVYTYSIRYNYVSKLWNVFKYTIPLEDAYIYQDGTIHAYYYGTNYVTEYNLSAEDVSESYTDVLFNGTENENIPIQFKWDTGQKTDSISNTKQFVESKLVFATLDERDSFPFTTYIAIDGDPHIVTTDISTDAPFWKNSESIGVLGTAFRLGGVDTPATGAFNTLRQLVLRYSGKGKSIRHVIEGESTCNFKLYETYVRYKNLNVK